MTETPKKKRKSTPSALQVANVLIAAAKAVAISADAVNASAQAIERAAGVKRDSLTSGFHVHQPESDS